MRFKFRINGGVWIIPKIEFASEWACWLYIKDVFKDIEINSHEIEAIQPQILQDQVL